MRSFSSLIWIPIPTALGLKFILRILTYCVFLGGSLIALETKKTTAEAEL